MRRLPGPMARVVEAVISRPKLERAELRDIATEAASTEVYRVERYVRILLVCATVLPLLGILGTLLTMVAFTSNPALRMVPPPCPVAATIESALLLSAAGIALAIPCYLFYMYLAARARKIINNIERAGLETAHLICDSRPEAAPTADSPAPAPAAAVPALVQMPPRSKIDFFTHPPLLKTHAPRSFHLGLPVTPLL